MTNAATLKMSGNFSFGLIFKCFKIYQYGIIKGGQVNAFTINVTTDKTNIVMN